MKAFKDILSWAPEVYLLLAVIYYWLSASFILNPVAAVLILALIIQIFLKNRPMGMALGGLLILLNSYMILALLSDILKDAHGGQSSHGIYVFYSVYFALNMIMSVLLTGKWLRYSHAG